MPGVRAHTSQHEKDPTGTKLRGLLGDQPGEVRGTPGIRQGIDPPLGKWGRTDLFSFRERTTENNPRPRGNDGNRTRVTSLEGWGISHYTTFPLWS